jgi:hypothetical protein
VRLLSSCKTNNMKITNKYNLPQAIVASLQSDYEYTDKRYSVTSLLSPIRETLLKRKYNNEVEADAVDMIWALWGNGIHKILEQETQEGELSEQQLHHTFDNGYTLSGYADFIDLNNQLVIDYKSTSIYQYNNEDSRERWKKQLQMYAYLYYKMTGTWLPKGQIWLFMKDWTKSKAQYQTEYPDHPVANVDFDLGTPQKVEEFVVERLSKLIQNEDLQDNDLPLCTPEERWNNGDTWAVMEKGKKRAKKVFDNETDAGYYANRLHYDGIKVEIEHRVAIDKKCLEYCSVNSYCDYFNKTYVVGKE